MNDECRHWGIMLDICLIMLCQHCYVACTHVQVGNSLMADVAHIAVDTDSTWLVQFCAFLHVTSCKHCEELIISKKSITYWAINSIVPAYAVMLKVLKIMPAVKCKSLWHP